MQHKCKITVLETKVFPDLQEKYLANPQSGPCPCFKAGQVFEFERTPETTASTTWVRVPSSAAGTSRAARRGTR